MDSDVMLFVAASLCDCLKVCHHKTSDTLRLALYQIINGNWQKYKQGIMPQPHLARSGTEKLFFLDCNGYEGYLLKLIVAQIQPTVV